MKYGFPVCVATTPATIFADATDCNCTGAWRVRDASTRYAVSSTRYADAVTRNADAATRYADAATRYVEAAA